MKDWERIRAARSDLTDYVIHLTRHRNVYDALSGNYQRTAQPLEVLLEILDAGALRPTYAPRSNRSSSKPQNTIAGPHPVVCLTEQTIEGLIQTRSATSRYSGYGIAYHKYALHCYGGRPVIYATKDILGNRLQRDHAKFEEGKEVFEGGLERDYQYLYAHYEPACRGSTEYPFDFTWEREWRVVCPSKPLPIVLELWLSEFSEQHPIGAILVERDEDVSIVESKLSELAASGRKWPKALNRVISLETAARELNAGKEEYRRIDTWPA